MLNSITSQSNNTQGKIPDNAWGAVWPSMLIFVALVAVFGIYPDQDKFWSKCRVAEWAVMLALIVFYIRDIWLKLFLLACFGSMVYTLLRTPISVGGFSFMSFHYILLYAIFYQFLVDNLKKLNAGFIINGLCVVALLQTAYIFCQHFKFDPIFKGLVGYNSYENMDVKDLVVGTWAHTNMSGAYLAMSIPLFLRKKWWIAIPVLAVALFWTHSWGAVISCVAALIFWTIFSCGRRMKLAVVGLLIGVALGYGSHFEHRQFNPLKSDRLQYIKPAIELIKIKPIVGWGIGQFETVFTLINQKIFHYKLQRTHAHFEILEILVEVGSVGTLPLVGFMLSILILFIRTATPVSSAAMSGVVSIVVNSCSTFIFHTPAALILLIYLIIIKKEGERQCY